MTPSSTQTVAIYGGTAPAIVAAVRAARAGLDVTLVTPTTHLGGALPSLGAVGTHYRGVRAPLLQEFIDRVIGHYRNRYGGDSARFRACTGGTFVTFEPHVAGAILRAWVTEEPRIRWLPGYRPAAVERTGPLLRAVVFRAAEGGAERRIAADTFFEGSYEGDLLPVAGVEFRCGREARAEFGEPRAGRVFARWLNGVHSRAAAEGRLNLVTAGATTSEPLPGSTGEGDAAADAAGRRAIEQAHRDHALGLMWFLQNDSAMPPDLRPGARVGPGAGRVRRHGEFSAPALCARGPPPGRPRRLHRTRRPRRHAARLSGPGPGPQRCLSSIT